MQKRPRRWDALSGTAYPFVGLTLLWAVLLVLLGAGDASTNQPSTARQVDERVCAKVDTSGRLSSVFDNAMRARANLAAYDTMLQVFRAGGRKDTNLAAVLNKNRGDILWDAISSYYFTGPMKYAEDPQELYAALHNPKVSFFFLQCPPSLNTLVQLGILPHLPESPYPDAPWLDKVPQGAVAPGAVLYYVFPIKREYLSGVPNALEGYILAVYGNPGMYAWDTGEVKDHYLGDLGRFIPAIPDNIVWFGGMDPDTITD